MSRTRPAALMLLLVAAPTLITATTLHARGATAVRERGGAAPLHAAEAAPVNTCSVAATAEQEQPTDPEGLSHMGVVVRRAWYKLLSSDARVHLLSGAIAATVSNTIVAPLDVIRLNIMV
jgi:hypothetical protein